jgi:hypothetical protein
METFLQKIIEKVREITGFSYVYTDEAEKEFPDFEKGVDKAIEDTYYWESEDEL